jgi:predicted metal-dependent enzyme (double-stranded beta helix superfamily)
MLNRLPRNLAALARRYATNPATWPVQPQFDPTDRWYARVAQAADHEAWLLTWLPGQATELHDHGGAAGAFHVVTGELTEQTLRRSTTRDLASRQYRAGSTRLFGAHHIHRVANTGVIPAISLHVYTPALVSMTRYRINDGRLLVAEVQRAGANW